MGGTGNAAWDRRGEVAGLETFWREAPAPPAPADAPPVLYVHGAPTSSDDFLPFLKRTGGLAPDLPGFGRSDKPAGFDYSIGGYGRFLGAFLERVGAPRVSLVAHDWGAVALHLAQRAPERVERLVLINPVPLLPGYRWHRIARIWRTPLAGELLMGFSTRWGVKRLSRGALEAEGPTPDFLVDRVWDHFDHGTQRAVLKLYRSAPPDALARAGDGLGAVRCPALVVWGKGDPYIPVSFARAYADALGGEARVDVVPRARHWPWIDRPEVVETVARFLLEPAGP